MSSSPKRKSRRLYVDILIVFVTLFLVTTMLIIGYLQYNQYQHSLTFSKKIVSQRGELIANEIDNYLKPAQVTQLIAPLFNQGSLALTNKEYITIFMEGVLRAYPYMSSIYMVDNEGNFIEEERVNHKLYTKPTGKNVPPKTQYITYYLKKSVLNDKPIHMDTYIYKDTEGHVLGTETAPNIDHFNPYSRPWYLGAKNNSTKYWLEVYPFFLSNNIGLTVSYRLVDKNQHLLGIIASDFDVDSLSDFLKSRKANPQAFSFIINDKKQLIAYSEFNSTHNEKNAHLLPITQLNNPMIVQAYQQYLKKPQLIFQIKVNGESYLVYFKNFSYGDNQSWLIGYLTPLNEFIAPLQKTKNVALFFSFLILLVGILLIALVSRNISRPIELLTESMNQIQQLKLQEPIRIDTHIQENLSMMDALNNLRTSLLSFSAYVPKEWVAQLVGQGELATLGFDRRRLTILFSDITGFSAIAEQTPPEQLAIALAEYFQILSDVIKAHNGTIDKYLGDGIMAFWGAPLADEQQVSHACQAALVCQEKIAQLNERWLQEGKPPFRTRIGLATGNALVGNIGAADRMNYTAMGEVVNLAAYLESLNKQFNTQILVTETIYKPCANQFTFTPLGSVLAKGSDKKMTIYQLVAPNETTPFAIPAQAENHPSQAQTI